MAHEYFNSDIGVYMFGYIRPSVKELKIKEFELFRGYYCGLCKSMGRSFEYFPDLR